jgi:hypothetical protein
MQVSDVKKMKALEEENAMLKRILTIIDKNKEPFRR